MKRMLAMFVIVTASVGVARADIGPPAGFKRLAIEHKITTEKAYPEYQFYSVCGDKVLHVKLDPKSPATIAPVGGGVRYRTATLVAVPIGAGKKFANDLDFHAAIGSGKVEGLVHSKISFSAFTEVKANDDRKVISLEYKLEKIDPKDGIVLISGKEFPKLPVRPGVGKDGEEESEDSDEGTASGYAHRSGAWVAGLAGTFAVVLGGLWITRRGRRDLA
ncbi:MAG: hypothetical protein C0467_14510 [Planctomycetaceae bacterium]|nr:hypothetical protein [Planctomycetaceae bacterium]